MRILIVDDHPIVASGCRALLSGEADVEIVEASDAESGERVYLTERPDVCVLDINLPGGSGFDLCGVLRRESTAPIMMLTARGEEADLVRALELGADDYLTKPFSLDVLLARVRAVSRRGAIPRLPFLEVGDLRLDPATRRVTRHGEAVSLTPREYSLLELLMRNAGRAVTRDTILDSVWGFGASVNENTLEVFIGQLRIKVDGWEPKLIHTIRGAGYMLKEPKG